MTSAESSRAGTRIDAIDLLRGGVMVLMLLDHVRDFTHRGALVYNPLDLSRTTALLYATRWVTHFCAPIFVFLAGVAAGLQALRGADPWRLSRFLWTRGSWLVLFELLVVRPLIWFNLHPSLLAQLQVIWATGLAMIVLAALLRLPTGVVGAIGLAILLGHNLLDGIRVPRWRGPGSPAPGVVEALWLLLHQGGAFPVAGFRGAIVIAQYPVLPWIGMLLSGYAFASAYGWPPERRHRVFRRLGLAMLAAFLALRSMNGYGDPDAWAVQADVARTVMAFFDVEKYPPSLLFTLVTLGPGILALSLLDGRTFARGLGSALVTFGRVPLFFYLLQWVFAHLAGIVVTALRGRTVAPYFLNAVQLYQLPSPPEMGGPLWVTYVCWVAGTLLLFWPCRWYAAVKARRGDWWLRYL